MRKIFWVLLLIITSSCSTIREKGSSMEELQAQLRDMQRTNAMMLSRIEELERKMYLLNLMQDRIESLSLKVDELSQKIKSKKVAPEEAPKPQKTTTTVRRDRESVAKTVPVTTGGNGGGYSVVSSDNGDEDTPVPVNPRLDLRGVEATNPENVYRKAMSYLKDGDYDRASGLFLYVVQSFPDSDLADNALYWTGECYYATHNYKDAIKYFQMVIDKYPDGNKVPDSMLKIGLAYLKMGNMDKAREYLNMVINNYPWSNPAKIAREKLKEIDGGQ